MYYHIPQDPSFSIKALHETVIVALIDPCNKETLKEYLCWLVYVRYILNVLADTDVKLPSPDAPERPACTGGSGFQGFRKLFL